MFLDKQKAWEVVTMTSLWQNQAKYSPALAIPSKTQVAFMKPQVLQQN